MTSNPPTDQQLEASLKQDGFSTDEIANMLNPDVEQQPIPLRWGLDDVMYGDDDTTIVMLSGPDREPYWLELDPERAAVLRQNLAGPSEPQPDPRDALVAEVRRLRAELAAARALAADATEYRVPLPDGGGMNLLVRRQSLAHGTGWAVSVPAHGGGRAWTTEGWQESISALSVDRLFCWPDASTAVTEARQALAAAGSV
jgi:hypothetical protein